MASLIRWEHCLWLARLEAILLALTLAERRDERTPGTAPGIAPGTARGLGGTPLELLLAICRHLRLLSAYAHACNAVHADYHSPLELMLSILSTPLAPDDDVRGGGGGGGGGGDGGGGGEGGFESSSHPSSFASGVKALEEALDEALLATADGAAAAVELHLPPPPPLDAPMRRACGYRLLLYLRHCLEGLTFPSGEPLPASKAAAARAQACAYLYDPELSSTRLRPLIDFDPVSDESMIAPRWLCDCSAIAL